MAAERRNSTTVTTAEQEPSTGLLAEILSRVDAIAVQQSRPSPMRLTTWAEIEMFAKKAARSGMVPPTYNGKDDAIVIAVMMGSELGLAPLQALQNIAVVNGRPSLWGDAMPGLCRASGVSRSIREWHEGEGDSLTFYCEAIRKDDPNPITSSFSVADAKKAGLWSKAGPWTQYPHRMLQMRARGFCLRDAFPDVLKGLISAEEASDIPFEATGLTPQVAPRSPLEPAPVTTTDLPKKTVSQWLAEIEALFTAAVTADDVDEIIARDDLQKMLDRGSETAKAALMHIVRKALARTRQDEPTTATDDDVDDTFPGDIP
jgi:hypothetical protein